MVLSFKKQFEAKILAGTKIHTIRKDPRRRWQKGVKIHFATGVRTKHYNQFKSGVCKFNQAVLIIPDLRQIEVGLNGSMHLLPKSRHHEFATNDGFDSLSDFWAWFNEPFYGTIIHWTDFFYG